MTTTTEPQQDEAPLTDDERAARESARGPVPVAAPPVEGIGHAMLQVARRLGVPDPAAFREAFAAGEAARLTHTPPPFGASVALETPSERDERLALAASARRARRERSMATLEQRAPKRFLRPFEWQAQHQPVRRWISEPGGNLVLWGGDVGTGKSHLLWQTGMHLARQGRYVVAWSVPTLNEALRPGGDAGALDEARSCDVLCLDELGAEKVSEWTLERLVMVINSRWENELPTVVTTNLDPEGLIDRYDVRLVDRLFDEATIVHLTGASRRSPQA